MASDLTLCREDSPQRDYPLRSVFNALRWLVRSGAHWRMTPHDFPPRPAVYQQTQRWLNARCFETLCCDLRRLVRVYSRREPKAAAGVIDSRTIQCTPESGARACYDGAKKRKGSKVHARVDTLGNLLTRHITPASAQDREQVRQLAQAVREATGETVHLIFADQGYTGGEAPQGAQAHAITLQLVKHTEAKRGFVLLPRRWMVERRFGGAARFRRLARAYER